MNEYNNRCVIVAQHGELAEMSANLGFQTYSARNPVGGKRPETRVKTLLLLKKDEEQNIKEDTYTRRQRSAACEDQ